MTARGIGKVTDIVLVHTNEDVISVNDLLNHGYRPKGIKTVNGSGSAYVLLAKEHSYNKYVLLRAVGDDIKKLSEALKDSYNNFDVEDFETGYDIKYNTEVAYMVLVKASTWT